MLLSKHLFISLSLYLYMCIYLSLFLSSLISIYLTIYLYLPIYLSIIFLFFINYLILESETTDSETTQPRKVNKQLHIFLVRSTLITADWAIIIGHPVDKNIKRVLLWRNFSIKSKIWSNAFERSRFPNILICSWHNIILVYL